MCIISKGWKTKAGPSAADGLAFVAFLLDGNRNYV